MQLLRKYTDLKVAEVKLVCPSIEVRGEMVKVKYKVVVEEDFGKVLVGRKATVVSK